MVERRRKSQPDKEQAGILLHAEWLVVSNAYANDPQIVFIDDLSLREAIARTVNHDQVAYRYCLPIQLLGKATQPSLDALRLQSRNDDPTDLSGWDARSLGKAVVAPFIRQQENVLGTSADPYVGNPMRIPRMLRDDPSKSDVPGWNRLVGILEEVQQRDDVNFTERIFRQTLLEILRRQQAQKFQYIVPGQVSLENALRVSRKFLSVRSGGDRALALSGALFEVIGKRFGLFSSVRRARINATDEATGQAADLECLDNEGTPLIAVEVKDRALTLSDLEGTLKKARQQGLREIFFTAPSVRPDERLAIENRARQARVAGDNLYVFDFHVLASAVLALGGESIRIAFLTHVGRHLDDWNIQPSHRQAWQKLLESLG